MCRTIAKSRYGRPEFLTDVGVPDLLINNAAVMNKPASLWEIEAAEFDTLVDVNIKANRERDQARGAGDGGTGNAG